MYKFRNISTKEDVQKYIELGYVPGRKLITNEENNYGN